MMLKPDTSLPWWGQVLDLQKRGHPTSIAAHQIATQAKARADARDWKPVKREEPEIAEPPADWSDIEDNLPWRDAK